MKVPPHCGGFSAYLDLVGLAFLVMRRKQFPDFVCVPFQGKSLCVSRKKGQFPVSNNWSCQLKAAFHFRVAFCLLCYCWKVLCLVLMRSEVQTEIADSYKLEINVCYISSFLSTTFHYVNDSFMSITKI